ncbi:MAG: phage tail tube protein [Methylocystis sp.]
MSTPYGASGAKVYISAAVTSEPADAAAYAALSWTEIGDVDSLGDFGDEASILTATTLQDQRTFKAKGPRDAGTMVITCLDRPDDAGQIALVAAEATKYNYPFKVVLPNRLTTGGTDEIEYLIGLVSSKRLNVGDASNIVKRVFNVAVNSKITPVAAT